LLSLDSFHSIFEAVASICCNASILGFQTIIFSWCSAPWEITLVWRFINLTTADGFVNLKIKKRFKSIQNSFDTRL